MAAECQVQINAKPMRESGRNWHERNRKKKGTNYQRLSLGFVTVIPVLVSMLVLKFEQGTAFVETGRIISASPQRRPMACSVRPTPFGKPQIAAVGASRPPWPPEWARPHLKLGGSASSSLGSRRAGQQPQAQRCNTVSSLTGHSRRADGHLRGPSFRPCPAPARAQTTRKRLGVAMNAEARGFTTGGVSGHGAKRSFRLKGRAARGGLWRKQPGQRSSFPSSSASKTRQRLQFKM